MSTDAATTSAPKPGTAPAGKRVFTVPLHRFRRGRSTAFAAAEAKPEPPPEKGPSRAAFMLALAHDLQGLVDRGEVPDRATLARQLGLTRAHVTQILDLLLLAPDIQDQVLHGVGHQEEALLTERALRRIARLSMWSAQHALVARQVARDV